VISIFGWPPERWIPHRPVMLNPARRPVGQAHLANGAEDGDYAAIFAMAMLPVMSGVAGVVR
jgi:hypothetical protein